MDIIQIVALGIVSSVLALTLKKIYPEAALLISISAGVIIFLAVAGRLGAMLETLRSMADSINFDLNYVGMVIKVIGISYVSEFGMQICTDAGESAIAGKIEMAGKILIMTVSAPVVFSLLSLILSMLPTA